MYVCMYVCVYVCKHVCVCMCVCMYVCMYACMYVCKICAPSHFGAEVTSPKFGSQQLAEYVASPGQN